MTTPLIIEMCLHYATRTDDYGLSEGRFSAPAVEEARKMLCELGLLEVVGRDGARFRAVREPMNLYVSALRAVPLPTHKWTIGDQDMIEIVDCPALHSRHIANGYPFGDKVPKTVRLRFTVTADCIPGVGHLSDLKCYAGRVYPAWTNSYGAVSAVFPDGRRLGLKLGEFEIVEWHAAVDTGLRADDGRASV